MHPCKGNEVFELRLKGPFSFDAIIIIFCMEGNGVFWVFCPKGADFCFQERKDRS